MANLVTISPPAYLPCVTGPNWPGVRYFYTTRLGGVGTTPYDTFNLGLHQDDRAEVVVENRRRLGALLPAAPLWLRQVHGNCVVDADACAALPTADGAVSVTPGRVLAIMTADCLPVLIVEVQGRALGVAHAGWRGLANGVLENTLAALRRKYPYPTQWRAWIGPSIGPTAFEVGEDVRQAFAADGPAARALFQPQAGSPDKWHANLPKLAAYRLRRAGVRWVQESGFCTVSDRDRFFSYRRDGKTGRMALLAWLHG
jgi:YfiH family protein